MAFAMIAAACGSDDDDADDTASTSEAPAASDDDAADTSDDDAADTSDDDAADDAASDDGAGSDDEAEAPAGRSGTLKWALGSNGANFFDPHKATNPFGRSWMYPFYARLTQIDNNGEVQPMLATEWQFSADGSSLTFTLREGVVFHDRHAVRRRSS